MKVLKTIFDEIVQTNEYAEMHERAVKTYEELYHAIIDPLTDTKTINEMECLMGQVTYESEYLGFVQGFKTARQLKEECDLL